jgi:cobalamin reductase
VNSSNDLSQQLKEAGLVGAGGGGFPTYIKAQAKADTVLMNAAACAPLINKDLEILAHFPNEVLDGFRMLMSAVGATRGIIGIKRKHKDLISRLERHLDKNMSIYQCADYYPAGDEFCLVYEATGKKIPQGGIPLDIGVVVANVETFYNISVSKHYPVTHKFVTLVGEVKSPCVVKIPVGCSFKDAIDLAGGLTREDVAIVVGGPMMGETVFNLNTPIDKATSGLVVLPKNHPLIEKRLRKQKSSIRRGRSVCDQCSMCTEMCPRYMLGYSVQPHKVMRNLMFTGSSTHSNVHSSALLCSECSLCSMYACPEDLDPRDMCIHSKTEIKKSGADVKAEISKIGLPIFDVHPLREFRKLPSKRLLASLAIDRYEKPAPYKPVNFVPDEVNVKIYPHSKVLFKTGDKVKVAQKISDLDVKTFGVPSHASVNGTVGKITSEFIQIISDKGGAK